MLTRKRSSTHPRPSRVRLVACALLALAAVVVSGCGGSPDNPRPKVINAYVSLGDSYTALAGVGPYTDEACRRTAGNYPNLVAKALDITRFTDSSCGGATSAALVGQQVLLNNAGTRPPQLDPVNKGTKLVTLGIGLNNYQIAYKLLYLCLPVHGIIQPACSQMLKLPDSTVTETVKSVANLVKDNLKEIRDRAPNARIVLVGYPRVLADDKDCPTALPLPDAAANRLRTTLRLVNQDLAKTAKSARVDYVDMYQASPGHELCSTDPWIAGELNVPGKALQFHAYNTYHQAVADKILALLKK